MICAISSVGRATRLHREGRGFESLIAHSDIKQICLLYVRARKPERVGARQGRANFQQKITPDRVPHRAQRQIYCPCSSMDRTADF